jgi:hypothetical protein
VRREKRSKESCKNDTLIVVDDDYPILIAMKREVVVVVRVLINVMINNKTHK